jgi:hypothetical protein
MEALRAAYLELKARGRPFTIWQMARLAGTGNATAWRCADAIDPGLKLAAAAARRERGAIIKGLSAPAAATVPAADAGWIGVRDFASQRGVDLSSYADDEAAKKIFQNHRSLSASLMVTPSFFRP